MANKVVESSHTKHYNLPKRPTHECPIPILYVCAKKITFSHIMCQPVLVLPHSRHLFPGYITIYTKVNGRTGRSKLASYGHETFHYIRGWTVKILFAK